jgi:hypothetical protein
MARGNRSADCRREQHGHSPGLSFVPGAYQALGVLKHLGIGRAARGGLFLGRLPALILYLAAIEAHL